MKKIKDVMTRLVETTSPTSTVKSAAQKMTLLELSALPVCDEGRVIGVLSDREITMYIAAERRDPVTTLVQEIMNRDIPLLTEDDDVRSAERIMADKGAHRVYVVDDEQRLVGIISLGKVARVDNEKAAGKVVKKISRSRTRAG
jgi:CBS domain-containing protein